MSMESFQLDNVTAIAAAYGAVVLVLLWLSAIFWVVRDIRSRSRDPLLHLIAILLAVFLFIPGVFIYKLIRPAKSFEEKYQAALDEEALLQEMDRKNNCPSCGKAIQNDWLFCPYCHTKLKKKCVRCEKQLELQWNLCPYCGETQQKPFIEKNQGSRKAEGNS